MRVILCLSLFSITLSVGSKVGGGGGGGGGGEFLIKKRKKIKKNPKKRKKKNINKIVGKKIF